MPARPSAPAKPATVSEYLAALPKDRRDAIQALRKVIKANLDPRYREGIQYGMIGYHVPHSVYPPGYHCDPSQPLPYLSIGAQKHHIGLYLFCVYASEAEQRRFRAEWEKTGKKLDMGKSCVRFKRIEDVPLDVIGRLVKRTPVEKWLAMYEAERPGGPARPARGAKTAKRTTKKPTAAGKTAAKAAAKKTTAGKAAARKKTGAKKAAPKKAAAGKTTRGKAAARKTTTKTSRR